MTELRKLTKEEAGNIWSKMEDLAEQISDAEHVLQPEHLCTICGKTSDLDCEPGCMVGTLRKLRFHTDAIQREIEKDYPEVFED